MSSNELDDNVEKLLSSEGFKGNETFTKKAIRENSESEETPINSFDYKLLSDLLYIDDETITKVCDSIDSSIFIVDSLSYEVAKSLAIKVAMRKADEKGFELKILEHGSRQNRRRKDVNILKFFDQNNSWYEENIVVVVDPRGEAGDRLISSISSYEKSYLADNKSSSINIYFILIISDYFDNDSLKKALLNLNIPRYEVDYLPHLMRNLYGEEATHLLDLLIEQRNKGLWLEDDGDFYLTIRDFFRRKRKDELRERIETAKNKGSNIKSKFLTDEINEYMGYFSAGVPIYREVIYTACYFDNLTVREFDEVVSLLIANKVEEISIPKKKLEYKDDCFAYKMEINEESKEEKRKSKKDKKKEIKKNKDIIYEKKSTNQIWSNNPDIIRSRLGLISVYNESLSCQIVDFEKSALRRYLRIEMEKKYSSFMSGVFERFDDKNLLFESSDKISQSIMDVIIIMAEFDSSYYGEDWVLDNIMKSHSQYDDKNNYNAYILSILIYKMLMHNKLKITVDSLIIRMLKNDMCYYVVRVINYLKNYDDFDAMYWVKVCIENYESNLDNDNLIMSLIYELLVDSNQSTNGILKELWYYMELDRKSLIRKKKMIISSVALLVVSSLSSLDEGKYKNKELDFYLFDAIVKDQYLFDYLIRYVFHPYFSDYLLADLAANFDDLEKFKELIGLLEIKWKIELIGINQNKDDVVHVIKERWLRNMGGQGLDLLLSIFHDDTEQANKTIKQIEKYVMDIENFPKTIFAEWFFLAKINYSKDNDAIAKNLVKALKNNISERKVIECIVYWKKQCTEIVKLIDFSDKLDSGMTEKEKLIFKKYFRIKVKMLNYLIYTIVD